MIFDFIVYFYYRICQYYNDSTRKDGPLGLFLAFNFSTVVNLLIHLLFAAGGAAGNTEIAPLLIVIDGAIVLLFTIIIVPIAVYRKSARKFLGKRFDTYKTESPESRRKRGRAIWIYMIASLAAFALTYFKF